MEYQTPKFCRDRGWPDVYIQIYIETLTSSSLLGNLI